MKVDGSTVEEAYFWLNEKGRIIEPAYCEALLSKTPMVCVHGKLYGVDGLCPDGQVSREILLDIRDYVTSNEQSAVGTEDLLLNRPAPCLRRQDPLHERDIFP